MNISNLQKRLSKVSSELQDSEKLLKLASLSIKNNELSDIDTQIEAAQEYYSFLEDHEKDYEIKNDNYKKSIEHLSESYLSMCPFYKGPNLPKPNTYLDSKQDISELYGLFAFMGICSMYGFNEKNNQNSVSKDI